MFDLSVERVKEEVRRIFKGKTMFGVWFIRFIFIVDFAFMVLIFSDSVFSSSESKAHPFEIYFALFFIFELFLRIWSSENWIREFFSVYRMLDFFIILSIFARLYLFDDNIFLIHVFGALRVLKCYNMAHMMFKSHDSFSQHKDVIMSFLNLMVFVFLMTTIVYGFQNEKNELINNYLDALYFTMATLTTTGFGDVTVVGTDGKLLAVIIMIFGVGLFLKLIHNIFRPGKVFYICTACGLTRHEPDASHCKHCGEIVYIEKKGYQV